MPVPIPSSGSFWTTDAPALIAAGASLLGLALVNLLNLRQFKYQREKDQREYQRQRTEDERKELRERLNSFYGPLQQLLGKSQMLYQQFSDDKPAEFRTLIALLEGVKFNENDTAILNEINQVTQQIETLILEHSGLVTDLELRSLLSQATAHFTYMRLAKARTIKGDTERFRNSVYPRALNSTIDTEVQRLQQRLSKLN